MSPTSPPATSSWPTRASSRPAATPINDEMDVTEDVIAAIDAQGGITGGGLVYGKTSAALEFVTEEYYRSVWSRWNTPEQLDSMVHFKDRNEEGLLADRVQLYGMEQFPLDHLTVLEGDLSKLSEPGGRYVAAVYSDDDYGTARDGLPLGPAGGHRHHPVCGGV